MDYIILYLKYKNSYKNKTTLNGIYTTNGCFFVLNIDTDLSEVNSICYQ